MPEPFEGFEIGRRYGLHKEMWPASAGYGTYTAGISSKGKYPHTEGVIVLARIGASPNYRTFGIRYENHLEGDVLHFSGQDDIGRADSKRLDQTVERGMNRALAHSREIGAPVYCFWASSDAEDWMYLGLGEVEGWSMVPEGNRRIVQFRIGLLGVASVNGKRRLQEDIVAEVTQTSAPLLKIDGGRPVGPALRKFRSQVFSDQVKAAYGYRCAICGVERRDVAGSAEVEAAHIYPVERDGADDVRNGLALCRLHHWAFDGGLLEVDDDLSIRATPSGRDVPGVGEFDGKSLSVTPSPPYRPHSVYLSARRRLFREHRRS